MADQLCTPAQVKARLDVSDAVDDVLISEVIDQVTAEIQSFTGRRLVAEAGVTYYLDTEYGHTIRINRGIRAVTSLGVAATDQPDDGSGTYLAVTATDIYLRPSVTDRRAGEPAYEIRLRSSPIDTRIPLRAAANGAKIVGDFGPTATPLHVARIAISASVSEYLDRRRSGQAGTEGIDLPSLISPGELASLARLRAPQGIA